MKPSTITLSILLLISSVLCVFLAYLWIDRSITLAYVNASTDSEIRSRVIMTSLVESEWHGKSLNEIYQKLNNEVSKHPEQNIVLKKTGEVIEFDNFSFHFENDKLSEIE